jgi:hypothetical protein
MLGVMVTVDGDNRDGFLPDAGTPAVGCHASRGEGLILGR